MTHYFTCTKSTVFASLPQPNTGRDASSVPTVCINTMKQIFLFFFLQLDLKCKRFPKWENMERSLFMPFLTTCRSQKKNNSKERTVTYSNPTTMNAAFSARGWLFFFCNQHGPVSKEYVNLSITVLRLYVQTKEVCKGY